MPPRDLIQNVTELGRQWGFVTFDELNELLPSNAASPEYVQELLEA
jgi:Sigma-70 factor, region 1.1